MTVNWLAVVAAALATFVLGGLWYGPLFGKIWMDASEITEEKIRGSNMPFIFGVAFAMQVVAASVLALFLGPEETLAFAPAVAAAVAVGVAWVAPAFAVAYLFERRPLAHFMVNAGYNVVAFTVMGLIIAGWR